MPAPSPIQLLPLHVVKLIVNHVVDSIRLCYDSVRKDSKEYKALLKPLVQVSHNFRAITLPLYCNYFKLNTPIFSQDARGVYDLLTSSRGDARITYRYLGHPTHHLSKELEIALDERTFYLGRALEVLSCAPYDIRSFPLVRKLELVFVDYGKGGDIRANSLQSEANISVFVERIRQMAPWLARLEWNP
ncbi:hypothetical protein GGI17_005491 [Coemansia sp. S146]|nr:hypothetical protein GGI17_005491 [Coemansia sp. S146]